MMINSLKDKIGFQENLMRVAATVELVLGVIILFYCIVSTAGVVFTIEFDQLFRNAGYLQRQLSNACLIIIGIELIMMITSHSVDSVVEVMLLAVSRRMIVEHSAPLENLLTVVAVALLFVIRKYLYISKIDGYHFPKGRENQEVKFGN